MDTKINENIDYRETLEEIKKSTQELLLKSSQILDNFKQKLGENSAKYIQMKQEYDNLRDKIISKYLEDRKITQQELEEIKQEVGKLQEAGSKTENKRDINKYYESINMQDTFESIKSKVDEYPHLLYGIEDKKMILQYIEDCTNKEKGENIYQNLSPDMQNNFEVIQVLFEKKYISISDISGDLFQDDSTENIQKIFSLIQTQKHFFQILGKLGTYMSNEKMEAVLGSLVGTRLEGYLGAIEKLSQLIEKINEDDIRNAFENIKKDSSNTQEIQTINLYFSKNDIAPYKEEIKDLLLEKKLPLSHFPMIQKHFSQNIDFVGEITQQNPDIYGSLDSKLKKDNNIVKSFIDGVVGEEFHYLRVVNHLSQIDLGMDIGNILIINKALQEKYSVERIVSLFMHDKIMSKMFLFLDKIKDKEYGEGQKEILKQLGVLTDKIQERYDKASKIKQNFEAEYKKLENTENKDEKFIQKIQEITQFDEKKSAELLQVILSGNEKALFKFIGENIPAGPGKEEKMKNILTGLLDIHIEYIESSHKTEIQKLGEKAKDIEEYLEKNQKLPGESFTDYKKRIIQDLQEKYPDLNEEEKLALEQILEGKNKISDIQLKQRNIEVYIDFLQNSQDGESFEEYALKNNIPLDGEKNERNASLYTHMYASGNILEYSKSGGGYEIVGEKGEKLSISPSEFSIIEGNEQAKENLLAFHSTLSDLNLSGLWKYREEIFTSLSNNASIGFHLQDDYLSEREVKIFLGGIMSSLGYEIGRNLSMTEMKTKIFEINNGGIIAGEKEKGTSGRSNLETQFIQNFDPKREGRADINLLTQKIQLI